jgi:lysophospholipid acyltransferase
MLCSHVLSGDTWKRGDLDFTGAMMILFLRAVSVGTNRADGVAIAAGLRRSAANGGNGDASKVASAKGSAGRSEYLQERSLQESPGLFDLAAFFFANGSLLGGPFFEFKEWDEFLHRRGQFYEVRL